METFRERLNEVLKANGTNQSKLAKQLKIERQGITNYKNGNSIPSLDTFKNLCIYLDVSADYLLGLGEYDGKKIEKQNLISDNRKFDIRTNNHKGNINIQ